MAKIQIEKELFLDLVVYAYRHEDPRDLQYNRIMKGVQEKIDAMKRREVYSQYKSGATDEIRSEARQAYLDMIGCHKDFRWPDDMDVNISHFIDSML